MPDKVMSPPKAPRQRPGVNQTKTSIIQGASETTDNIQPFNKSGAKPSAEGGSPV